MKDESACETAAGNAFTKKADTVRYGLRRGRPNRLSSTFFPSPTMADSTTARYTDHEDHFRKHFRNTYKSGESHTYGDYEAGYRTGFRYGTSREHASRDFEAVEPEMRRRYEREHGDARPWREVKGAARHAFERGRSRSASDTSSSTGSSVTASGSRETASGGPGSAMREGGFAMHRETYRQHHRETYGEGERDFSAHEPAYRHGHRYGASSEHAGRSFDELEPEMQRTYEEQHGTGAWAKVKDAVRHAFGRARSRSS